MINWILRSLRLACRVDGIKKLYVRTTEQMTLTRFVITCFVSVPSSSYRLHSPISIFFFISLSFFPFPQLHLFSTFPPSLISTLPLTSFLSFLSHNILLLIFNYIHCSHIHFPSPPSTLFFSTPLFILIHSILFFSSPCRLWSWSCDI